MGTWGHLSARQWKLLQQVADGDDLSGPDGLRQRITALSLNSKRLVQFSRRDDVQRVEITAAGRTYLKKGPRPTGLPDDAARQRKADTGRRVEEERQRVARDLIAAIQRAGGTLRLANPGPVSRASHRQALHSAVQYGLVPDGFQLDHTGRSSGDLIMRLVPEEDPLAADPLIEASPVDSSDLAGLGANSCCLQVSDALLPRAIDILRLLAEQARPHGRVVLSNASDHPELYLVMEGDRFALAVREKDDGATPGQLTLEIGRPGEDDFLSWSDHRRTTIERRMPRILREFGYARAARIEAAHAGEAIRPESITERLERAEQPREQPEEPREHPARSRAAAARRAKAFQEALGAWSAAQEIRAFCDALMMAGVHDDPDIAANRAHWIAWGRAEADRIDPSHGEGLAYTPFDQE
ncbi:hypothetical protein JIG36_40080 [Actinoplanes sp. LDG1-06]|uniref:Uncharacterized protein n=1 Tax=Paractinoplanes ovalisporus TaxID=2810368 RepID=A0ABS2APJ1_9ACTN|nr:hypothetical protein [Actinoplanes ovalisporus]MBM2621721.1 hypothetical protein [Actinoplanes ovalisporus]